MTTERADSVLLRAGTRGEDPGLCLAGAALDLVTAERSSVA
jgi:hypothetical protein